MPGVYVCACDDPDGAVPRASDLRQAERCLDLAVCGKTGQIGADCDSLLRPAARGSGDAWPAGGSERAFLVRRPGAADPAAAPAAADPRAGARSPASTEPQLRQALRPRGAALDPAGAVAERPTAAGLLRHPLRAAVHG